MYDGGGAFGSYLTNCTIVNNNAGGFGGGVAQCNVGNCIIDLNSASTDPNISGSTVNFSCTTPLPLVGDGNIASDPLFINPLGGNFRLQSNSPCINSGNNAYAPPGPELDGNTRISGGSVDMGAYELQNPASVLSYSWAQQYGLPTDGSADSADTDGDGAKNWQEWRAGTIPTDAASALVLASPVITGSNILVTWQSEVNHNYYLQRTTNLTSPFLALATNIIGQAGNTSYADTNAATSGPFFYRVGVQ
jgi:hypothetical protein